MSLLSPLLWSFLPSRITHFILPYLTQSLPAIFPAAQQGSPEYARNYRYAYTLVVTLYLGYSFLSESGASNDTGDDWYRLLEVGRLAEDGELKKAFRKLSRTYHPDRAESTSSDDAFIYLRRAYEGLSEPTTRYAYDRFGPELLASSLGNTPRGRVDVGIKEWMMAGLMRSCGFYIVSAGIMGLLAILGTAREGAYWRLVLLFALLTAELLLVLSPTPATGSSPLAAVLPSLPAQLTSIFSPLRPILHIFALILALPFRNILAKPQFLQVRLLHRAFTSLSIGISQLAGVWADPTARKSGGTEDEAAWNQLANLSKGIQMEAIASFQNEVIPMLSGPDTMQAQDLLKRGMEQVLVDKALASHPATRAQWQEASMRAQQMAVSGQFHQQLRRAHPNPSAPQSKSHHDEERAESDELLEMARRIALPPSPPPSPTPFNYRLLT